MKAQTKPNWLLTEGTIIDITGDASMDLAPGKYVITKVHFDYDEWGYDLLIIGCDSDQTPQSYSAEYIHGKGYWSENLIK